jgi:putative SOS response-associated peptidase YedK
MCGRFAISSPTIRLQQQFGTVNAVLFTPRYNIAPSLTVPVIEQVGDERVMTLAQWGLLPSWVKEPGKMPYPINAKVETAALKPMFRHAYRHSRILVPADAFYEWQAVDGRKQPYLVRLKDKKPFGMGGLLEHWTSPDGMVKTTFTILTTSANPLMAPIHDRMPVIIQPGQYSAWLDPAMSEVSHIQALITPFPESLMEAYPISTRVNSPVNDGPDIMDPLPQS